MASENNNNKKKLALLVVSVLVACVARYFAQRPPPKTCVAKTYSGTASPAGGGADFWPNMHGSSQNGASTHSGPVDLTKSFAWKWHHPQGRFYTVLNGVVIDGSSCLYVSGDDEVVKLSPDGATMWTYCSPGWVISAAPVLMDGYVYGSTGDGLVYALDASTGEQRWLRKVASNIGFDTHAIAAHSGLLIVPTSPVSSTCCGIAGGGALLGLNATNGNQLWQFRPDAGVWNFYAVFFGDESFCFQDMEGRAYCNRLSDGSLIWKRGGMGGTWNDGSMSLGPDGLIYAVTSEGPNEPHTTGVITAYRHENGTEVWKQRLPHPPNQFPAVGRLGAGPNVSVVVSIGTYYPSAIFGLDALTGEIHWKLPGPLPFAAARGDLEGLATRQSLGRTREKCLPNAWSNPSIDASGTIYIGHNNGQFWSARDSDGNGKITSWEVSVFDAEAGFPGAAPGLAKDMVAIASCDSLFVFKA